MADKYFVRRDMQHGIVALIGENTDQPYEALVSIKTPHGHVNVAIDKNGDFNIELHPDGLEAVPVLGSINKETAIIGVIASVAGHSLYPEKGKLN